MEKKLRKIASLVLASAMVMSTATMFAGCKKKGANREKITEDSLWYNAKKIDLEIPYSKDEISQAMFNSPVYIDGSIYVVLVGEKNFNIMEAQKDKDFDYNQYILNSICQYDLDGNLVKEYPIENCFDIDAIQVNKLMEDDGRIKVELLGASVDSQSTANYYGYFDPESGKIVDTYEVSFGSDEIAMVEESINVGDYVVYSILGFSEGDEQTTKLCIEQDGKIIKTVDASKELGKQYWNAGEFIPVDEKTLSVNLYGEEGSQRVTLSLPEGKLAADNSNSNLDDYYFQSSQNGVSYAVDDRGIFRINDKLEVESVMTFYNANINSSDAAMSQVTYLDDNKIILFGSSFSSSVMPDSFIFILDKADKNPNAGKMILNVYSLSTSLSYSQSEAIVKFNNENKDYFAVCSFADVDYEDAISGSNDVSDQLMIDLINGDGPDIVLNGASYQQFNNSEYFIDLKKYMDGENGIDKSKYFASVIDAATWTDGALYQMPISFSIEGIVAKESDVGAGRKGFTYDQYNEFVDKTCNGKSPVNMDKLEFLVTCLSAGSAEYMKDGKVDFNTAEFKDLAAFIKDDIVENPDFEDEGMGGVFGGSSFEGGMYDSIMSCGSYLSYISEGSETVKVYGLPSATEHGPSADLVSSVAISSQSDEDAQNASWEFVKAMLSEDVQSSETMGNPINKAAFTKKAKDEIDLYNEAYDMLVNMGMSAAMIKMYGLYTIDEAVVDDYVKVAESVETVDSIDTSVAAIVLEEVDAYFEGQKSIDDVISVLNNRAQTVVNERAN
ncbi:MAG: ABC transporter substrate-binding protein [Saccharofermentans sp.]|nr:ABC transporter substrate-binding protein [Saccharofermentans sp.]